MLERGIEMTTIRNMFSIYIVVVMLAIGLYMTFVQSRDLTHIDRMEREGTYTKVIGYLYIAVALIGFVITLL
ncbi:MAG: hypothetical protein K0S71_1263 [Clostridia bacterium]|jgi:hypothetical protein|nr:hypothetical protein [Clostridia bacterium]